MKTWTSLLHSAKQNGRTIRSEIGTLRAFENNDCTFGARVRIVHLVDVPFLTLSTWLTYLFVFARLVWYMPFPTIFIRMMYFSWRWPSVLRTVTDAAHLVDVPSVFAHVVWQIKHFRRCQSGWCTFPDAGHLADVPFLTLPTWLTYLFWRCPSGWRTFFDAAHLVGDGVSDGDHHGGGGGVGDPHGQEPRGQHQPQHYAEHIGKHTGIGTRRQTHCRTDTLTGTLKCGHSDKHQVGSKLQGGNVSKHSDA